MPSCIEAVAAMQAVVRIGAIHATVFAGFSYEALRERINDCQAKLVITMDGAYRGGRHISLRDTVISALSEKCSSVQTVLTFHRDGNKSDKNFAVPEHDFEQEVGREERECLPVEMDSEAPLYIMYTSGSTGKPKGLVHTTGGFCVNMKMAMRHAWDISTDDILGCPADIGWQVGHSMNVYGSMLNGNTALLFESTPVYPDPGRFYQLVERYKVTHFMSAPTAYRMLMRHDSCLNEYDMSSLRAIATCGEITDMSTWKWLKERFGGGVTPVLDSWWQTETGCPMINPWPADKGDNIPPGKSGRPFYGIEPCLLDEDGESDEGHLCIKNAWPGMARTIYNDHSRYVKTYFSQYPGYYASGDGARRDQEGFYQLLGRKDDVINVAGHRLCTAEIENIVSKHETVAETAVVGVNNQLKGETPVVFVIAKSGVKTSSVKIESELISLVRKSVGSWAVPSKVVVCEQLPKTRSGKIMRRILRAIGNGSDDYGDRSVIADITSLEHVITRFSTK